MPQLSRYIDWRGLAFAAAIVVLMLGAALLAGCAALDVAWYCARGGYTMVCPP